MRSARKEPNQRVYKASPEKTSGRGSAPARHAAKHAKKRSLFGRAKQENSAPETAAPAPQPEVAEEDGSHSLGVGAEGAAHGESHSDVVQENLPFRAVSGPIHGEYYRLWS